VRFFDRSASTSKILIEVPAPECQREAVRRKESEQ
jgi:hypothetical protein